MSWVLYETVGNIVRNHIRDNPGTPPAGLTKIERTVSPNFNPSFITHEWVFDESLDDFSLVGPFPPSTLILLGEDVAFASDEQESTTTSITDVVKVSLVVNPSTSGTYRMGYTAEVTNTSAGKETIVKFKEDSTILAQSEIEPKNANDFRSFTGFVFRNLNVGSNTLSLTFAIGQLGTGRIRRARIEFWRVI